ncbi:MAG TPA: ABC transporter substrate-binding protein [Candidatus Limnocylindrales bacterium]|jgi:ribose transport system substrate-binding protein|nr:ABC transporter substrate-binding protein [Candidatus Limnocylindrales bacterium]
MNSERIRSGVAFAAMALLIAACSSGGGGASPAATSGAAASGSAAASAGGGEKPYIPIVSKGFQHQFWQAVKKGAEEKATELNVTVNFEGPENESQVDKQMEMLQAELDKNPAAVCFAALDSQAAVPLLQKFKDKNIPVIGFDSGVDSDIPVTTAATDNLKAAGTAADKLGELIGGSGKVGVIVHDQTSRTGIDRRDGFVKEMQAKYPNVQIIGPQYGGGDQLKSTDLAKAMIQGNPDIKGFFGANEGSAIGVINAVKELNKSGSIVVVGYDSGQAQIDAINSGLMAGAITQNPIGIGQQCVDAAVKAIKGETLPKTIDTGFYWYDKTNINNAEIQAVLYK